MVARIKSWRNRRAYARARAEAQALGQTVCGTLDSTGKPIYFLMPPEASEAEIAERAFALREGRSRTEGEKMLHAAADTYRTRTA